MTRARVLWTLLLLTLLGSDASAVAATGPAFGLKALDADRGYFVYDATPGQTLTGHVRVVNAGREAGTVRLRPADAATGRTTGVVYETRDVKTVGTWLRLATDRLTLKPGESAVVGFTVTVPDGTGAGDHLGGIVAQPEAIAGDASRAKGKRAFRVDVVEQSIVAVQVVVPGPARSELKLTSVRAGADPGFQTLLIGISNPGDLLMHGEGAVRVLDDQGHMLRRQVFSVDTFVPGTQVEDPVVVRGKVLPAGSYEASVIVRWAGGHSTTLRAPFTVSDGQIRQAYGSENLPKPGRQAAAGSSGPNALVIAGGALLALLAGIGGTVLYFRRRTRVPAAPLVPPDTSGAPMTVSDRRPAPAGDAVAVEEGRDPD